MKLNSKKSKQNRDKALAHVAVGEAAWLLKAYKAVRKIAEDHRIFTADDAWKVLTKPDEPRALGHVMRSLQRDGIIIPTQHFKPTAQPARHAAPVRIWRSLIWVEEWE